MSDARPRCWSGLVGREGIMLSVVVFFKRSSHCLFFFILVNCISMSTYAEFTWVSIVQNHFTVAWVHPCLAHSLQAKFNPAAGLQVRQGELKVVSLVPQRHLFNDVVCTVEVEGGEEEEGEFAILGAVPGQWYAAAVPRSYLKVLGNIWVWLKKRPKNKAWLDIIASKCKYLF